MTFRLWLAVVAAGAACAGPSSRLLYNADGRNAAFASVARLRISSTCTGVLLDTGTADSGAPAYVATAGHCLSLEAFGVMRDQPLTGTAVFNYFVDTRDATVTVRAKKAAWSTMKGTDLAVVELDATVGELLQKGLRGHRLAATRPRAGAPVSWVGAPTTFIPSGQEYMRQGRCSLNGSTAVVEGRWFWHELLRTDCPDVYNSASGSPVFDERGEVIGILGTTTSLNTFTGPEFDCFMNYPCAVGHSGVEVEAFTSYAAPAAPLAACFEPGGRFNVEQSGCPLDRGNQLAVDAGREDAARPVTAGRRARWNARLSGALGYYRWKQIELGKGDCREPAGYSAPAALRDAPVIEAEIGGEGDAPDGRYALCVLAGDSPAVDATWQPAAHPSVRLKRLDATPPEIAPFYEVEPAERGYRVVFNVQAPGLRIDTKRGPAGTVDCADPAGYRPLISVPPYITSADFPYRMCMLLSDDAGNAAAPRSFEFGPPALEPWSLRNLASLQRVRSLAAGALFRLDGLRMTGTAEYSQRPSATLAGIRVTLADAAGRITPVLLVTAGPDSVEGRLPENAAPGPARLSVHTPSGAVLLSDLEVAAASPGIFAAQLTGSGPPLGYARNLAGDILRLAACEPWCSARPLPLGEGVELTLYATGTGGSRGIRLAIGTEELPASVEAHPEWPGVDIVTARIPASFPLRGYQFLRLVAPGAVSPPSHLILE